MELFNKNIDSWNKWDLHLHSPKSNIYKEKDFCGNLTCEVGKKCLEDIKEWAEKITEKWIKNGVTLASITDHNLFDKEVWEAIVEKKPDSITVVPGMEVDAYMTDKEGNASEDYVQLIIHINPEDLKKIIYKDPENGKEINRWNNFYQDKLNNKEKLTVDDVMKFFILEKIGCNLSVEGEKARGIFNKYLNVVEGNETKRNTIGLFNWGYLAALNDSSFDNVTQSRKKLKIWLEKLNKKVIDWNLDNVSHFLASDNHCPSVYPLPHHGSEDDGGNKISFFNGRNNFMGLCLALRSKGYKIKSSDPTNINSERQIKYVKVMKDGEAIDLEVSKRLNIIIGPRSSGKTLFLKLLSIYSGSTSASSKKYKELKVNNKNIQLISYENKLITQNNAGIKEFEQGCFIDSFLKKKPLSIVEILSLEYPQEDFLVVDENLKDLHKFYVEYKDFLQAFFSLLNNNINLFKDFKELTTKELGWYTVFSNNLSKIFSNKNSILEKFEENVHKVKKDITQIKHNLLSYESSLSRYNLHVEKNSLNIIFPKKLIFSKDDFKKNNLLLNEEIINLYESQMNQLNKRLSVFDQAKMNFEKKAKANLKGYEEKILERDKNYREIESLFSRIGKGIKNIPRNEIIIDKVYKVESSHAIPKRNYDILPTRVYHLRNEGKESFNKIIAAPLKNLIRDDHEKLVINPQYYLDENFIKKFFIKDGKGVKISVDKIFNDPSYESDYDSFRSKIFESKSEPIIKQNGAVVEDNSPGMIAQIYFDIETFNLLDSSIPIILFDQPEDSIDNRYIANKMTQSINDLLNNHKQVFLVTHNANLVVNTSPDNIIIPFLDEKKEIQYTAGRLEDEIKIGDVKKNTIEWVCDYVEGGKRAFFDRLLTYEIGWNNNGK